QGDATQFAGGFPLLANPLPATFTLCASDAACKKVERGTLLPGKINVVDPSSLFPVRLIRLRRGEPTTLRVARTMLPPKRAARLRPIARDACLAQLVAQGRDVVSS